MQAAISYKRFSTQKQARGDSERRQTDLATDYCRRHQLRLIDTYLDAGASGFTGANMSDDGALRALLQAAKLGKFQSGTRLIVESLDRLSRREITTAVRLFLDILDTGLVIVTLIDGEQVFTKERVDSDLTALIIAIVYLSRANNESRNRRERALQAQQSARRKARERKTPITAECPAWLTVVGTGNSRRFVIDKSRAQVIEEIFKMSASGMGQYQIVSYLNRHHVPPFSQQPKWRPGMIGHLLCSQAVIGVFHPCLSVIEDGRRRRIPDPDRPIEGYFPPAISAELYQQGRLATSARLRRRRDRRIPAYANLVPRIGRCAVCGATLHHFQNVGGWAYLRCANARHKECSNRFGFPYGVLETVLLALDDLMRIVARLTAARADESESEHAELADQEVCLARLKAMKVNALSDDLQERDLARRSLIAEFRQLIEGVVLHSNQAMTMHVKPDAAGYHAVGIIARHGIQAIQVKAPTGRTGLVERSLLIGIVPSLTRGQETAVSNDESVRQLLDLGNVLEPARIVYSAEGDWQVMAPDPMQMAPLVARGEHVLRPR